MNYFLYGFLVWPLAIFCNFAHGGQGIGEYSYRELPQIQTVSYYDHGHRRHHHRRHYYRGHGHGRMRVVPSPYPSTSHGHADVVNPHRPLPQQNTHGHN